MRLRDLAENELDEAQRKVWHEIAGGPRGGVRGPFGVLMRRPLLANRVQKLGEYCRFQTALPDRIMEFAIIITARHWTSQVEWNGHSKYAMKHGLGEEVVADLRLGLRPRNMQADEAAAYQFCIELQRNQEVSDASYAEALKHFGEAGVLDLIGVTGYYTLVAMVLKVSQKPLPPGTPDPLPRLDTQSA